MLVHQRVINVYYFMNKIYELFLLHIVIFILPLVFVLEERRGKIEIGCFKTNYHNLLLCSPSNLTIPTEWFLRPR